MTQKEILKLAGHGLSLNGFTLDPNGNRVDVEVANREFLRTLATAPMDLNPANGDSPELKAHKERVFKLMKDAMGGDKESLMALNAVRIEIVDNYIKATSNFMSFFSTQTLLDNETAYIQNVTGNQEISVAYISQEGKPFQIKIEKDVYETPVPLRYITSDDVWYYINDINKGRIADVAQKTFDIGFDMRNKMDRLCYKLLNLPLNQGGCFGAFSLTGRKVGRIYLPHSNIITDHLPATNDLIVKRRKTSTTGQVIWCDASDVAVVDEPTAAVNGFFGVAVLMDIVRYANSWGGVFPDGPLTPTGEVIVPSSDIFDILFGLGTVGVNVLESQMQRDIQEKGYTTFMLWGINWKLIPDVTIPSGVCFPKFNKVPGRVYMKPSQDLEFVVTDLKKNIETRSQKKVFNNFIINQKRLNCVRLTYK